MPDLICEHCHGRKQRLGENKMGKDKNFKVQYMRTDTGSLQIFVMKNKQLIANLTVFPDNHIWLDLPESNRSPVDVFPDNALHRVWYKEVCRACGWESEPFEGIPCGLGGQLNCPECSEAKRNWNIEVYGHVDAIRLDWETKKPLETNHECKNNC